MEPMDQKSNLSNKPLAGMIVIVVVAMFVGGWLYVDSVRSDMQLQIDGLSSQLDAMRAAQMKTQAAVQAPMAPATDEMAGWQTVTSKDGSYQLQLPPEARLSESADGNGYADVVPVDTDPNKGGALPFMSIQVAPASQLSKYQNQGGKVVVSGAKLYWLSLWEDMEWKPFDQVAASFKVLK